MSLRSLLFATMSAFLISFGTQFAWAQDAGPSLPTIVDAWIASPHADRSRDAFRHWDEDGEIPGTCATCHSSYGSQAYTKGDMSTAGRIEDAMPLGSTIDCAVCHNSSAAALTSVPFPSGVTVDLFGKGAICATCHQGRSSTVSVNSATEGMEPDTAVEKLRFINIHYKAAAATMMGSLVQGGYEYPDKDYKGQFTHVPELNTCTSCHRPHSTKLVPVETCAVCHKGVDEFTSIRTTPIDIDGDGDAGEGILMPIQTIHAMLGEAITRYAQNKVGKAVVYDDHSYPYFFNDNDGNGVVSDGEASYPNRYQSWTPRLLKAAYNYQYVAKDGGSYAHNPHYVLQLLYDSLEDLSSQIDLDMSGLTRP